MTQPGFELDRMVALVRSGNLAALIAHAPELEPADLADVLSQLNDSPVPFRFAAAWFMMAPSLIFIFVIRKYLLGLWGRVAR